MKYKLTIIKYDDNENYEEQLAKFKENERFNLRNMYMSNGIYSEEPTKDNATRSLEVILTEDEYVKVKTEVLKVFE